MVYDPLKSEHLLTSACAWGGLYACVCVCTSICQQLFSAAVLISWTSFIQLVHPTSLFCRRLSVRARLTSQTKT